MRRDPLFEYACILCRRLENHIAARDEGRDVENPSSAKSAQVLHPDGVTAHVDGP